MGITLIGECSAECTLSDKRVGGWSHPRDSRDREGG